MKFRLFRHSEKHVHQCRIIEIFIVIFCLLLLISSCGSYEDLSNKLVFDTPVPLMDLQKQIDLASPGDTINVPSGTYNQDVVINKAIKLIGPNSGISPTTGSRRAEAHVNGTITLAADNITINGFRLHHDMPIDINITINDLTLENNYITGWAYPLYYNYVDLVNPVYSTNWQIKNNWIGEMVQTGGADSVMLLGGLKNSCISNNTFTRARWGALRFSGLDSVHISDNTFSDCHLNRGFWLELDGKNSDVIIKNNSGNNMCGGIKLYASLASCYFKNIRIKGNTFSSLVLSDTGNYIEPQIALWISHLAVAQNIQIDDNVITQNVNNYPAAGATTTLIDIMGNIENLILSGNTVTISGTYPIDVQPLRAIRLNGGFPGMTSIMNNNLIGGSATGPSDLKQREGILFWHGYNPTGYGTINVANFDLNLINNTITGFAIGLKFEEYSVGSGGLPAGIDIAINLNNIYGNSEYGILSGAGEIVDARFNYWGATTGPTHSSNLGGTGDTVSDYIDYTNFSTMAF